MWVDIPIRIPPPAEDQGHPVISPNWLTGVDPKTAPGVFPPEEEVAAIQALRAAFPDHPLRLDPNANWTVPTSHRVARSQDLCAVFAFAAGAAAVAATMPSLGAAFRLATRLDYDAVFGTVLNRRRHEIPEFIYRRI